jgi:hypothetical protein
VVTAAGLAWTVSSKISELLATSPATLKIMDSTLKVVTECPPWRQPTRKAIGRAFGTIAEICGVNEKELSSDGKVPKCTIYREVEHQRPLGLLTWSSDEGYVPITGGIRDEAVLARLLAELNSSS